jgi:formylglycine-generating enzyme required for sulfatase activity/CheY-like chemotaxis protein
MRILIVDDDTSVIQMLLATLKTLPGHDVRVATTGDKALENAASMGGVDLLITDVVMDPMDGFTLRDQIHTRYPDVRTILISGYDLSDYPEQTEYHLLLQKPFDASTLIAAVQRELALVVPAPPVAVQATSLPKVRATTTVTAIPQPRAVPAAQPAIRATAVPTGPVARGVQPAVAGTALPRAVAANAVPNARPQAVATAPRAAAPIAVGPSPFATKPAPPAPEGAGESLIGQMIGAYQIVSYLGEGRLGSAYAAVQISINRPVGLKVLDPGRAQDETVKSRFIADARAKAHVQHPAILAVYEAGESGGRIFYAREYVDGQSLTEIAASRQALDDNTALKIIRVVAEGFVYLTSHNIPHRPLEPNKIFLGMDGQPRLANIAVQVADEVYSTEREIQLLGQIMIHLVAGAQILSPAMNALLARMTQAPTSGLNAWGQVIQAVKALEPKVVPVEAARITAQDQAAIKAVEVARKQQKRAFWINVASLSTLFIIVVFIALRKFVFTNERTVQKMVKISAGSYKLYGGKTLVIERDYWIDKYEVTWGQYARFLEFLEKNPTADQDFRHPRMPRHLTHDNDDARLYLGRARVGAPARGVPIDLNSPAITVTWWDAYAYAKWLGAQTGTDRDLPTEEEWEVAAAGNKGEKFPWGSGDASGINTGADHDANRLRTDPKNGWKGKVDGYNMWSSVDALSGDRSPLNVFGMGGNVAEWTSTWTADNRFPIIKGGSFASPPQPILAKIENHDPSKVEDWLGFRTISRTPPPDAE